MTSALFVALACDCVESTCRVYKDELPQLCFPTRMIDDDNCVTAAINTHIQFACAPFVTFTINTASCA